MALNPEVQAKCQEEIDMVTSKVNLECYTRFAFLRVKKHKNVTLSMLFYFSVVTSLEAPCMKDRPRGNYSYVGKHFHSIWGFVDGGCAWWVGFREAMMKHRRPELLRISK